MYPQGIIGRVTDTVKNIVPGWLQKYFGHTSKVEPVEAKRSIDNHDNDPALVNETPLFDNRRHNSTSATNNTAGRFIIKCLSGFVEMFLYV